MQALILAAGYATRLYPLTKEFPKPLLPVGKRPIIDFIIDKLKKIAGIDEISVVTNTRFMPQFRRWRLDQKLKKRISLIDDLTKDNSKRRGAIGDMDFAIKAKRLKEDLLVIGGDNLFDGELKNFVSFARNNDGNPVIGVFDIKSKTKAKKYGVVRLNSQNKVVDFQEKPAHPSSTLVAMCLYYFPKDKVNLIKEYTRDKKNKKDAAGFYIDWLRKRIPVYGFVFSGCWYDIGDYQFYNQAKRSFA